MPAMLRDALGSPLPGWVLTCPLPSPALRAAGLSSPDQHQPERLPVPLLRPDHHHHRGGADGSDRSCPGAGSGASPRGVDQCPRAGQPAPPNGFAHHRASPQLLHHRLAELVRDFSVASVMGTAQRIAAKPGCLSFGFGQQNATSHLGADGSCVLVENEGSAFRPSPCLSLPLTPCLLPCLAQVCAAEQHGDGSPEPAQLREHGPLLCHGLPVPHPGHRHVQGVPVSGATLHQW